MKTATVEGEKVKVGDFVGFKYDYEMTGRIVAISKDWNGAAVLDIRVNAGDEGDRVHQETADRCWLEG